jgi:hypothetical protein
VTTIELKKELEELDQRLSRIRQFVVSVLQDTTYFKDFQSESRSACDSTEQSSFVLESYEKRQVWASFFVAERQA